MRTSTDSRVWTVDIRFDEDPDRTDAAATVLVGDTELGGWGRARRNPSDPSVPTLGEELAAARALSDLAHKLLDDAASRIAEREGHAVHLHT